MEITKQTQNPQRYSKKDKQWIISALPSPATEKEKKEIKPLKFDVGLPLTDIKAVLDVDGILVKVGTQYLCSKNTLKVITESNNPHYDIVENGKISVKTKEVTIGKTIPIISIDSTQFSTQGSQRDLVNQNAGVKSVDYIYEGKTTEGVSNNLIKQINYTLGEETRPGDTFELYDLKLADASAYSIEPLAVTTTQEDGKFDTKKLDSFLLGTKDRLKILQQDFNMIKDTFYAGIAPLSKGIIKIEDRVASAQDDTSFGGDTYTKKSSTTVGTQQTPKDDAIDAQKKATEELAKKAADALKLETDALKTTQKTLQERVADAGSVTDYVRQNGGWDKYVRAIQAEKEKK
jgi:hypothetical protein